MVRIGTKFEWNGKVWTVTGFNKTSILIQSGTLKTSIEFAAFEKLVQVPE